MITAQEFLNITFTSFWHFVGMIILIGMPLNFIVAIVRVIANRYKPDPTYKCKCSSQEDPPSE